MNFSCSICMESFGTNCAIATIPCGHVFHEACIEKWHINEKNCAICRKKCKAKRISKLFLSENESAINDTNISIKYEEKILKFKKEIQRLKVNNVKLSDQSELNEENIRLAAENVRLAAENVNLVRENLQWQKDHLHQEELSLEFKEDINNLSKMIRNLKCHERIVQKSLRDAIEEEKAKKKEYLGQFIEAKREIIALEAKIPKTNNKRKQQQLQERLTSIKSPPKKKKKKQ